MINDLLSELKRRKVVRVAVVYAATAFVVLQAADLLASGLSLPHWVFGAITVVTVLGFPLALVLAWAFELTPEGVQRADTVSGAVPMSWLGRGTLLAAGGLFAVGVVLATDWVAQPERAGAAGALAWRSSAAGAAGSDAVVAFDILSPEDFGFDSPGPSGNPFALSPDGRTLVYQTGPGTPDPRVYIRRLEDLTVRDFGPGTGIGSFSPDGRWLLQWTGSEIRRIDVQNGTSVKVVDWSGGRGFAWNGARVVMGGNAAGLSVVDASGGVPAPFTTPDSAGLSHRWPIVLPDGETVLFHSSRGMLADPRIGIASLRTGRARILDLPGASALGMVDDLLVYHDGASALLGVPFDLRRWRVTGDPIVLVENVAIGPSGGQRAALSASGSLVYLEAGGAMPDTPRGRGPPIDLFTADLDGEFHPLSRIRQRIMAARYSPDGRRVALTFRTETAFQVWIHDLAAGTLQLLAPVGSNPEWTPDGRDLLYVSDQGGSTFLVLQPADGSGPARPVHETAAHGVPTGDGEGFVYAEGEWGSAGKSLWFRRFSGDTTSHPIAVSDRFGHGEAALSPDGRWIAFSSNETGSWQLYVQRFPGPGPRYAVSAEGGEHPLWSPDGRSLYYSDGSEMYEAALTLEPAFSVSRRRLFSLPVSDRGLGRQRFLRTWDLAPNGSHFLFRYFVGSQQRAVLIHNWASLVRERRAGGR